MATTLANPSISWFSIDNAGVEKDLSTSGWIFGRVDAGTMSQSMTDTQFCIWNNKGNTATDAMYINDCRLTVVDMNGRNDDATQPEADLVTGTGMPSGNGWVESKNIGYGLTSWSPLGSKYNATTSHYDTQEIPVGANGTTTYGGLTYTTTNGDYNPGGGMLHDCILGYKNDGVLANAKGNYSNVRLRINIPPIARAGIRNFLLKLSYYHA